MSLVLSIFLGVGYPVIFLAGIRLGRKRTEAKIYKKFFVPGEKMEGEYKDPWGRCFKFSTTYEGVEIELQQEEPSGPWG